ncbi:hypothetical protein ACLD0U_00515 [Microbacterium sp. 2216-1]|uniref:hypothetical protein n=1 Tax=Microbacterium TaxID=33882 RepID=UPI001CD6D0CB|nr:hypothetical protein [Microbacterium esteraromaticum]MCA1307069.1 hypothetical protein [Microbacterium esteraromaticum]
MNLLESCTAVAEHAQADQAPGATASIAITDPTGALLEILRISLVPFPLSEADQRAALQADGALLVHNRPFRSRNLGEGIEAVAIAGGSTQLGSARWLFCRPTGSVLAVLGPVPARVIGALTPSARSVLDMAAVQGLEADGVPFAQQEPVALVPATDEDAGWDR